MNKLYIEMGCRLREEREKANLTQWKMAEILDISMTYYGNIERGINGLSTKRLVLLWEKLKIDPLYILTGDHHSILTERIANECPVNKRKELERLIECAIELVRK